MRKIKIVTDSCSDLKKSIRDKYDIEYLQMFTVRDSKETPASLDWEYYSPKELYDYLRRGERVLTAQVPQAEFERAFNYSDLNNLGEGEEMYGNYNGVSFFHSSSNKYLHRFLKQFGYDVNYNYFSESYSYAAPSTDAFLSVGAVSSLRDYKYGDFTVEDPLGMGTGFTYYLNKNVLPVIFETDKSALDFDFYQLEKKTSGKDYFKFQNDWYRSMFPEFEEDFFLPVEKDQISVEYKNTIEYDPSDYKLMAEIKKSERIATDSSLKARSESADKLAGDDGAHGVVHAHLIVEPVEA